jgi:hypothetical protein
MAMKGKRRLGGAKVTVDDQSAAGRHRKGELLESWPGHGVEDDVGVERRLAAARRRN